MRTADPKSRAPGCVDCAAKLPASMQAHIKAACGLLAEGHASIATMYTSLALVATDGVSRDAMKAEASKHQRMAEECSAVVLLEEGASP